MHFTNFLVTALAAGVVSAQSLTSLLGSNSNLSGLAKLLKAYPSVASSLASAKNVTLFAPNNKAISALLASGGNFTQAQVTALLDYHVVPGVIYSTAISATPVFAPTLLKNPAYSNVTGGQVVEAALVDGSVVITSGLKAQSTVVQANLNYTGGVVHVIDSVLTIPVNTAATALAGDLTDLVGAVLTAGLAETLDTASDITVFAPANSAFLEIGSAVSTLTKKQLTEILEYHVISGTVAYSTLLSNESVATLEGAKVTITVEDGSVFVNAARVINADILIAGGVLHVIDSVLNPNNATAEPVPASTQPAVQFSGVSSAPVSALTVSVPAASTTVSALVATTESVAKGLPPPSASSSMSSSSALGVMPTAAIGVGALFGGAALMANW